ncbi:hypothetical protein HDV57DRAFT_508925 [Trichoderma longibrachiatum]
MSLAIIHSSKRYHSSNPSRTTDALPNAFAIPDEAPEEARSRATYHSFGEDGLTATASAYGHLLQMTQYFGKVPSGFASVDLATTSEPYLVAQRANDLHLSSLDPTKGTRLLIEELNNQPPAQKPPPGVGFVHNRWPRFFTTTSAFDVTTQYVISGKTVYQIYSFKRPPGSPSPSRLPSMEINADILLRNLDFSTRNSTNARKLEDPKYTQYVPVGGHCVVRVHGDVIKGEDEGDVRDAEETSIALFISPFINGIRQQPLQEDDSIPWSRRWGSFPTSPKAGDPFEITLAYTLRLVSSNQIDKFTSPVSEADLEAAKKKIYKESLTPMSITIDRHLDFTLHRNLEHILSVCSIPIDIGSSTTPAMALTCGDISGHRVTGKASFHAFQFLLSAFRLFDSRSKGPCSCQLKCACEAYSTGMRKRILEICWGHVKWLIHQAEENPDFSLHKWADGRAIANRGNHKSLRNRSVIDGCFRIIALLDFCRTAATREMATQLIQRLGSVVSSWIEDLHQFRQDDEHIFPHCVEDAPQKFYLADHAMIWFTLRSLESLESSSENQISLENLNLPELLKYGSGGHKTIYSSSQIRKSILTNFAAQSRHLDDKLLIATCRSICETSFLLQDQDAMTLHCMAEGLFDTPSSASIPTGTSTEDSAWQRTMEIQQHHHANDDETWTHPARFALAMIVSKHNIRINSRSALDMHNYARSILLNSSSPNGLFPGQLDENKGPYIFQDDLMHDSYWHTTFEVPCTLWRSVESSFKGKEADSSGSSNTLLGDTPNLCYHLGGAMKRSEPLALNKDQLSTTLRWLYSRPRFLRLNIDLSSETITEFCESRKNSDESSSTPGTIDRAAAAVTTWGHKETNFGYIIDIAKSKNTAEPGPRHSTIKVRKHEDMGRFLGGVRDPTKAKKRFLHFYQADLGIALNCYLASSEREQMSSFLDRHASYTKYFFEDKAKPLNKWATELHLTFYTYQHASKKRRASLTIPLQDRIEFPSSIRREQPTWVSRATMSFRFDGDISDRYWTCHFFEARGGLCSGPIDETMSSGTPKASWQQRRVLELLLFDAILGEMVQSTRQILKEVINTVLQSSHAEYPGEIDVSSLLRVLEAFPNVDSNMFASLNELWNKCQHILQVIEDDLRENLAVLELWMDRQEQRRGYKLQWGTVKEQIYGDTRLGLELSNNHRVHELKRCLENVASFNILLTRRLEVMRSDLEMRSNLNIRLFTYVTVVFLPISFATSVFSMNGTPPTETLVKMAKTAGVALAITVVALLNAKLLAATLRTGFRNFYHPVRFFAEVGFLILLSLVSAMPREYIYPKRTFFHEGIESELEQIRRKVLQEENHRRLKKDGGTITFRGQKSTQQSGPEEQEKRETGERDEISTWQILEMMGRAWLKLEKKEVSHEKV